MTNTQNSTKPWQIAKAAQDMGLDVAAALLMRKRYLVEQRKGYDQFQDEVADIWRGDIDREIEELDQYRSASREKRTGEMLTQQEIDAATAVPVTSLIEFNRGKALAWCHDDHTPSLFYGSRKNLAVCPVCDKKFNSIHIVMHQRGVGFRDAVKILLGKG